MVFKKMMVLAMLVLAAGGFAQPSDCVDQGTGLWLCSVDSFSVTTAEYDMKRQNKEWGNRQWRPDAPYKDSEYFASILKEGIVSTGATGDTTGAVYWDQEKKIYAATKAAIRRHERKNSLSLWVPSPWPAPSPGEGGEDYIDRVLRTAIIPLTGP